MRHTICALHMSGYSTREIQAIVYAECKRRIRARRIRRICNLFDWGFTWSEMRRAS